MSETPTRPEALRRLIEKVEDGETNTLKLNRLLIRGCGEAEWYARCALGGSLDAVASLEAPLRQRGWQISLEETETGFNVFWWPPFGVSVEIVAMPAEARARLLAVLKAMLWEAEHEEPADARG